MHYRRLGRWGLKISEISLGDWITFGGQVEEKTAIDLVHAAYAAGVNFFDSADVNAGGQGEVLMGRAIRGLPREGVVLSSKVFFPTFPGPNGRGLSRKHIFEAVHASLKRLGTDYLDIYFCHGFDPDSPYEEVVFSMNTLIQQGKILYWGTSGWTAAQISTAHGEARRFNLIPPSAEQVQYNMFRRHSFEMHLAPLCADRGLGLMVWGPLASGILSGKYNHSIPEGSRAKLDGMAWLRDQLTPERVEKVHRLTALAGEVDLTTAQLAIAWLLRRKDVCTVITGATSVEQLEENLEAGEAHEQLSEDILERIEEILGNLPEDE
ncbi:MAG: aldo/keto reductase [Anaerolineales bacterium]|nr:aldo/keto reductase [Anaerolineales bacterium]